MPLPRSDGWPDTSLPAATAALASDGHLRILVAGPDIAVRGLPRPAAASGLLRPLYKGIEAIIRRLPLPASAYEIPETLAMLNAFGTGEVDLTVLDSNRRLLALLEAKLAPLPVETVEADLAGASMLRRTGFSDTFDIVIAIGTLGRFPGRWRPAAAANLVALAKPGGLVVENTMDLARGRRVVPAGPRHVYRRIAAERGQG